MDWTLEVVVLPVSDIDRSIAFCRDQVGFHLDHDRRNEYMHVTQLAPHGSGCSTRPTSTWCLSCSARAAAASEAARAAMVAASAAYLHPLADAHQVKHILGAAAHAARAAELAAGDDPTIGATHIDQARRRATSGVVDVLRRYSEAPAGGGRAGELLRDLDETLRHRSRRPNIGDDDKRS